MGTRWHPKAGLHGQSFLCLGEDGSSTCTPCWDVPSVFLEFILWPRLTGMGCRVRTESCTQLWLPLSQRLEYSLKQQEDSTVNKNWAVLLLIPSLKKKTLKDLVLIFFSSS